MNRYVKCRKNGTYFQQFTLRLDEITKGVLHAEAVAAKKSISALLREWIDERLDLPENGN